MKPPYLADMRSVAYSVLLCHYVYRDGLSDQELNSRLRENGIIIKDGSDHHWRRKLTREGFLFLETMESPNLSQIRWRLTPLGKGLIEKDLARLTALETLPPLQAKADGAITNLKSFLRSTRAYDPW